MIRHIALAAASALALSTGAALAQAKVEVPDTAFSFEGPFGKFDQLQLQRGLQVYTQVCAACHGMRYVPIRSLAEAGGPSLPEDQVRAYAAAFPVNDEASNPQLITPETGQYRALEISDNFPRNTAAGAPDLSVMAKARAAFHGPYGLGINQLFKGIGGPEYIHAILTGYAEAPACATGNEAGYYNMYFGNGSIPDSCKDAEGRPTIKGSWIAMPPPLADDQVTYADGTPATLDQMSMDVSAFLTWAAEPKMMERKRTGFVAVVFLAILSVLLYLTNKRIWAAVKGRKQAA
ncbi:MAG: cytochrome c1 [Pseudomonadota bacterium]|jgi:ubiquinol-cytochrome c reductase cytochrome c1 subunit